ncbi:MAG: ABC transporter ATP-binding protein, partial [Coriobacteriia bacterium]
MSHRQASSIRTLLHFYRFTSSRHKAYPFLLAGNVLLSAASPFPNILLPMYIINELIGAKRIELLALYTAILIGSNFVISILSSLCTHSLQFINMQANKQLDFVLVQKAMEIGYEHIENVEILELSERAASSMKWGIWGMYGVTQRTTSIASGIIALFGLGYLFSTVEWWIVALLVLFIAFNIVFGSRLTSVNLKLWGKTTAYNRKFQYFSQILKDFKFGKDIHLYDASGLIMDRQEQYIEFSKKVFGERANVNIKYNVFFNLLNALQQTVL